jgi:hypothetical protein
MDAGSACNSGRPLDQLQPQLAADRMGGAGPRAQGDGVVVGIEHAVELGAHKCTPKRDIFRAHGCRTKTLQRYSIRLFPLSHRPSVAPAPCAL